MSQCVSATASLILFFHQTLSLISSPCFVLEILIFNFLFLYISFLSFDLIFYVIRFITFLTFSYIPVFIIFLEKSLLTYFEC